VYVAHNTSLSGIYAALSSLRSQIMGGWTMDGRLPAQAMDKPQDPIAAVAFDGETQCSKLR